MPAVFRLGSLLAVFLCVATSLAVPTGTTTTDAVAHGSKTKRGVSPAELAAREVYAKRQWSRKKAKRADCPSTPQPSGKCTQDCGANEIPQTDGTCRCNGLYLPLGVTDVCVTACPAGTKPGTNAQGQAACISCGDNVATCDPSGPITCKPGFGLDPTTKTCQPCKNGASTCSTPDQALTCPFDNLLNLQTYLDPILGICVTACPPGTYQNGGLGGLFQCLACGVLGATQCSDNGTKATQCGNDPLLGINLYLNPILGTCVSVCPDGTYADGGLFQCLACATGVKTCTSATKATSCGVNLLGIQLTLDPILGICL